MLFMLQPFPDATLGNHPYHKPPLKPNNLQLLFHYDNWNIAQHLFKTDYSVIGVFMI